MSPTPKKQVVPTAVPNSFSPPPTAEKGFGEIFFGKNPNKGKVSTAADEQESNHIQRKALNSIESNSPRVFPQKIKKQDHAPLQYRVLSLLPYLIPCMGAIAFTGQAFLAFPGTFAIAVGISPLLQVRLCAFPKLSAAQRSLLCVEHSYAPVSPLQWVH